MSYHEIFSGIHCTLAKFFLERNEEKIFCNSSITKPNLCFRHVDNIFAVFDKIMAALANVSVSA